MQRGKRVITLQGAIENEWLIGTIIISYFGGNNNIFADSKWEKQAQATIYSLKKYQKSCIAF